MRAFSLFAMRASMLLFGERLGCVPLISAVSFLGFLDFDSIVRGNLVVLDNISSIDC